ncbi:Serine_threonine-protein kinase PknD [Streptomyces sp. enrichment culture]|uniref:serine/threonine-protein kinase n=1 Tax=Streptomyces sp. enrichment culture TaxID=1795815 RepID=UPI003F563605
MKPLGTGDPIRLGPYRLLGVLGEGGMGKVYVGQDRARAVAAVKVLRPELAHDQNLSQRFVREALAAQAVRSTGVAAVLGAQTEGGRPWIATEFLAGPTLDEAVERYGPLDEPRVRALAASIARTLTDIHTAGFIHRDLKPQNIVLTATGPRVIDFGIARPEHGLTLTTTGQVPVTPGYGAPEQVLGRRVTPAADVFSLGAVLVYAATGRRAFQGGHVAAVQYEVVHGEPQWHGLSPELHALIAPCLAKDEAMRPAAEQVVTAFGASKNGGRVWTRGPLAEEIKQRESRMRQLAAPSTVDGSLTPAASLGVPRRRLLTAIAAGGAALTVGGATTGWWQLQEKSRREAREALFSVPPAAQRPQARLLDADAGDYVVGESPKALWITEQAIDAESPAPMPVRDVVVVGGFGGIAAHNVVDGKLRWERLDLLSSHYLSLSDRLIVAIDAKGTLVTFVPSTGEPKWTVDAGAKALLAADEDLVYVLTKDDRLRAVRRSDATIRWTAKLPAAYRGKISTKVALGGGRLVLPSTDGHVLAVASEDGRFAWEQREQAEKLAIEPVVQDGIVYVNGKTLSARKVTDGTEIWSESTRDEYRIPTEWGPVSVHEGSVYSVGGVGLERLAAGDGKRIWRPSPGADSTRSVLFQGTGVWMIDTVDTAEVRTLDIDEGYTIWTYELKDAERNALAVDGFRAFVRNGASLHALPVF